MVYSGMGPDYRLLVKYARKLAQQYVMMYDDEIPTVQLVRRVADVMQEYTQSGLVEKKISLRNYYFLIKKLHYIKWCSSVWSFLIDCWLGQ